MKIKNLTMSVVTSLTLLISIGNTADSGWESVEDYSALGWSNLPQTIAEGQKFEDAINTYGGSRWNNKFRYKNSLAWEQDFKDPSKEGKDNKYADDVDLVLFSGHGSQEAFYFGTQKDDFALRYSDAKWGNNYNLEWIIIDACNVLDNRDGQLLSRWATPTVFSKLHFIFGYETTTYDVSSRGEDFVKYAMQHNFKVRDAWIKSTIISENGTRAAYLRAEGENSNTFNDHLWGHGYTSPDPTGSLSFWYCTWGT